MPEMASTSPVEFLVNSAGELCIIVEFSPDVCSLRNNRLIMGNALEHRVITIPDAVLQSWKQRNVVSFMRPDGNEGINWKEIKVL